jgi:hypothetical protein
MEQALAVRWKQSRKSKNGSCNQTGTVFNILHAFDLQLHKIRTQNLQKSTSNLGGTANNTLPFQVEPEPVLKKVFKSKDKLVTSTMKVKVTNGIKKSNANYGGSTHTYIKQEQNEDGYSSSGSSTLSHQPPPRKVKRKITALQPEN